MLVTELIPQIRELPREDKLLLMEFLMSELAQEGINPLQPGASYPVWSPYDAHEAAQTLEKMLEDNQKNKDA